MNLRYVSKHLTGKVFSQQREITHAQNIQQTPWGPMKKGVRQQVAKPVAEAFSNTFFGPLRKILGRKPAIIASFDLYEHDEAQLLLALWDMFRS